MALKTAEYSLGENIGMVTYVPMDTLPIANDVPRRDEIVTAMAQYLNQTLRMSDPASNRDDLHWKRDNGIICIERSRAPTLASTLYDEARYMPDTAQLDYLDCLSSVTEQAERAEKLANELIRLCEEADGDVEGGNVSDTGAIALTSYASWWGYYHFTEIQSTCGIVVGGLGRMLKDRITIMATTWLLECDKVLCLVHKTHPCNDGDIEILVNQVARDISKRVTLHNTTSSFSEPEYLEPASLGARNELEFTRVRVDAQCKARNDMRALLALKIISREPMSSEAKFIFDTQLLLRQMLVQRPPQELGLGGDNARRMNLAMLGRCLIPGMDTASRMHIANGWANRHGAWAQTAIAEAIRRLEGFSPSESSNFIQVATSSLLRGNVMMPAMPWAPWAPVWYAIPPPSGPTTRTGLDEEGIRVVRLASVAWQLVGAGAFEQGVVSGNVVFETAFECLQLARLGRELIENERMRSNVGVRLLSFNQSINDCGSELAGELDKAQCYLGAFSLRDINDAFNPKKPLLETIYADLTSKTRAHLSNKRTPLVPEHYQIFVAHALACLLPAIEQRREAIHVSIECAPHPLGDMLRTVPKCRAWSPLQGRCTLTLDDLQGAHPHLRGVLEYYAQHGSDFLKASHIITVSTNTGQCVQDDPGAKPVAPREWIDKMVSFPSGVPPQPPPRQRKTKALFEFESAALLRVLKM